jgi:DNA-directed RNA polymerase subunit K
MVYTRFERARMIGARALQISMGAPTGVTVSNHDDAQQIAFSEFASGDSPLSVPRVRDAFR